MCCQVTNKKSPALSRRGDGDPMNDLHDIVLGLVLNAVYGFLAFLFRASMRPGAPERGAKYSRSRILRQFYICLACLIVGTFVFAYVRADTPFSVSGIIKSLSSLLCLFSLIFLVGAFDAALEYQGTEDKLPHGQRDHALDDLAQCERKR